MTDERKESIRDHLAALYAKHGTLTPALIVKDAKSPRSVLHDEFEWDDSVAGQAWREEQARTLIRTIRVTISTEKSIVTTVAYVRDPNAASGEQGYVSVESLQGNKDSASHALAYACGQALGLIERARELAVALDLVGEADKALGAVRRLRERAVTKAA